MTTQGELALFQFRETLRDARALDIKTELIDMMVEYLKKEGIIEVAL